jgi:hypothetical protein
MVSRTPRPSSDAAVEPVVVRHGADEDERADRRQHATEDPARAQGARAADTSRSAAIGGTLAARRAGKYAATTVTTTPDEQADDDRARGDDQRPSRSPRPPP